MARDRPPPATQRHVAPRRTSAHGSSRTRRRAGGRPSRASKRTPSSRIGPTAPGSVDACGGPTRCSCAVLARLPRLAPRAALPATPGPGSTAGRSSRARARRLRPVHRAGRPLQAGPRRRARPRCGAAQLDPRRRRAHHRDPRRRHGAVAVARRPLLPRASTRSPTSRVVLLLRADGRHALAPELARRRHRRARRGRGLRRVRLPQHRRRRPAAARSRPRVNLAYPIGDVLLAVPRRRRHDAARRLREGPVVPARRRASRSTSSATRSTSSRPPRVRRPSAATSTRSRGRRRSCSCRWRCGCARAPPTRSASRATAGFLLPGIAAAGVLGAPLRRAPSDTSARPRSCSRRRRCVIVGHPARALGAGPAHPDRAAPPTGDHRRAHRARQPPPPLPGARHVLRGPVSDAAGSRQTGVPVRRPQPLQGDQRLLRPPGRRRAPAPARTAPDARRRAASNVVLRLGGDEFGVVLDRRRRRRGDRGRRAHRRTSSRSPSRSTR